MSTLDILRAVKARIQDPKRWTTHALARDEGGNGVPVTDPDARQWCVNGALLAEHGLAGWVGPSVPSGYWALHAAARLAFPKDTAEMDLGAQVHVNNKLGHGATIRVLDVAIAQLEELEGEPANIQLPEKTEEPVAV